MASIMFATPATRPLPRMSPVSAPRAHRRAAASRRPRGFKRPHATVARTCGRKPLGDHLPRRNLKRSSHRNQQYSITALTDGSGSVVERYAYTSYGQVTFANASGTVQMASASNNRYTYTGREWDEGLSLYHYRARLYDAVAGRFVSRDPIGYYDGYNLYWLIRLKRTLFDGASRGLA
jgi:RHS repeat-associated protein